MQGWFLTGRKNQKHEIAVSDGLFQPAMLCCRAVPSVNISGFGLPQTCPSGQVGRHPKHCPITNYSQTPPATPEHEPSCWKNF